MKRHSISRAAAVLASFLLLLSQMNVGIMELWYVLDNESFTEMYCINVDKPEMDCHGQCMMQQELKSLAANDAQNPISFSKIPAPELNLIAFDAAPPLLDPDATGVRKRMLFYESNYSFLFVSNVLKPPRA